MTDDSLLDLTLPQISALKEAYKAKLDGDGWLVRDFSAVWQRAPRAIYALERKGYLETRLVFGWRSKARLTEAGLALIEGPEIRRRA